MEKEKLLKLIDELVQKHKSPEPVPIKKSKFLEELINRIKQED